MKVQLIAHTVLTFLDYDKSELENETGYLAHPTYWDPAEDDWVAGASDADELAEFAGRVCYQSWNRPNPVTATNEGYLANIVKQQHFSVLEHASASFYISGISRSCSHELIRHRHLSYSELSQRYVDVSDLEFVVPPVVAEVESPGLNDGIEQVVSRAKSEYGATVHHLQDWHGVSRKDARGAARNLLPQGWETRIVVSGNHRAWREFLGKRLSPAAEPEIRNLAVELLKQLAELAPNTYSDLCEWYATGGANY